MSITKIKRNLAKIGIGNPLNRLVYTSKEIEKQRRDGLIFDPSDRKPAKRGRRREYQSQDYKVGYSAGYKAARRSGRGNLEMDNRLKVMSRLWCQWNRKKLDSEEFVLKFRDVFNREVMSEWNSGGSR